MFQVDLLIAGAAEFNLQGSDCCHKPKVVVVTSHSYTSEKMRAEKSGQWPRTLNLPVRIPLSEVRKAGTPNFHIQVDRKALAELSSEMLKVGTTN